MEINLIGVTAGLAAFMGIWFGHVAVRKIEYISSSVMIPTVLAALIGVCMEVGALLSANLYATTVLGILGVTFLWDAIEFYRQHKRVQFGHAPANPVNPRHARILAGSSSATTVDLLKREPTGRRLSVDALHGILEEGK